MKLTLRHCFITTVFMSGIMPRTATASLPDNGSSNSVSRPAPYDFSSDSSREKLQETLTKIVDSYQGRWLIPNVARLVWNYVCSPTYYTSTLRLAPYSYVTPRYYISNSYKDPDTTLNLHDAATSTIMHIALPKEDENCPVTISKDETQLAFIDRTQLYVRKLCYKENNPYFEDSLYNLPGENDIKTCIHFLSNDTLAVLDKHYTMSIFKIPQFNGNNSTLKLQKRIPFKQINSLFQSTHKIVHILDDQHLLIAHVSRTGIPQVSIVNATGIVQQFSYPAPGSASYKNIPRLIRVISGKRVVYLGEPYHLRPKEQEQMHITQLSDDCRSITNRLFIKLPKYTFARDVSYFGDYVALQPSKKSYVLQPIELLDTLDTSGTPQ